MCILFVVNRLDTTKHVHEELLEKLPDESTHKHFAMATLMRNHCHSRKTIDK